MAEPLHRETIETAKGSVRWPWALALLVLVALALVPLTSQRPDGLEFSLEQVGAVPAAAPAAQESAKESSPFSPREWALAIAGTLAAAGLALLLTVPSRLSRRRRQAHGQT